MTPLLSVILPVYNGGKYVRDSVRSILDQTEKNFELLLCDDGSTDGTLEVAQEIAKSDPRVRFFQTNRAKLFGVCNRMLKEARGEFLARMDHDDISLPQRFAEEIALMQSNPQLAVVGVWLYIIDPEGRRISNYFPPTDDAALQELCLDGHCPINEPASMMRTELVRKVGGWREDMGVCADVDLWLKLGEVGKLGMVSKPLQCYRYHEKSQSHKAGATKRQDVLTQICREAMKRRNITGRTPNPPIWPPPAAERYQQYLQYGWWAFRYGDRSTAAVYGWRAVRNKPLDLKAWRLLACAVIKPMPPAGSVDQTAAA
jgi:glycosyltransferase involved in cell wall biosynthesis